MSARTRRGSPRRQPADGRRRPPGLRAPRRAGAGRGVPLRTPRVSVLPSVPVRPAGRLRGGAAGLRPRARRKVLAPPLLPPAPPCRRASVLSVPAFAPQTATVRAAGWRGRSASCSRAKNVSHGCTPRRRIPDASSVTVKQFKSPALNRARPARGARATAWRRRSPTRRAGGAASASATAPPCSAASCSRRPRPATGGAGAATTAPTPLHRRHSATAQFCSAMRDRTRNSRSSGTPRRAARAGTTPAAGRARRGSGAEGGGAGGGE